MKYFQTKNFYSFVIPAYNEEKLLSKCLSSLKKQKGASFEIIVVDNNSTDKTALIAKKMGVTVVNEKKQGLSNARNRGFKEAKGNIICFIDADGVVSRYWLQIAELTFKTSKANALSGLIIYNHKNVFKQIWYNTYTFFPYLYQYFLNIITGRLGLIPGNNMAIRREVFEKLGGFESVIGEDFWLTKKYFKMGFRGARFIPGMIIRYSSRGFDAKGYLRTIVYWFFKSLKKTSQKGYSWLKNP
jgi:glycosyltransferase involved in cell wall biosynthesis